MGLLSLWPWRGVGIVLYHICDWGAIEGLREFSDFVEG